MLDSCVEILNHFPEMDPYSLIEFIYPHLYFHSMDEQLSGIVDVVLGRFGFGKKKQPNKYLLEEITEDADSYCLKNVAFKQSPSDETHFVQLCAGKSKKNNYKFVYTDYHSEIIVKILMAHSSGDICIIGERGSGKSIIIKEFARILGYETEYIPLYKDMSSRTLLQRRSTATSGDTIWENSGLVEAALHGRIAIMDQIDLLSFGTLESLQRFVTEREFNLPDGSYIIHYNRYNQLIQKHGFTHEQLKKKMIYAVHPCFRIICIARPTLSNKNWLGPEILSMFHFVPFRTMNLNEELHVIKTLFPTMNPEVLNQIIHFANSLRLEKEETLKTISSSLSTRQLLRIARRMNSFPQDSMYTCILKSVLSSFLPLGILDILVSYLKDLKITPTAAEINHDHKSINIKILADLKTGASLLNIGSISAVIKHCSNPLLVPQIIFYENQRQTITLENILKDWIVGEHLLLIGNQGVGKNKLIDYFLQLMKVPREYIQLHRDTTVYSLTSNPTVINGQLVYEDSPLVRAVKEGHCLVVDEADKAPTHVTCVLKSLVEDGEMVLSDGRRIVHNASATDSNQIQIHPEFRMVVLANRPGFPFLGNDFYREIGDVFSCHCILNPDADSELELLKKYAPHVSEDILIKLIASFNDLRRLYDEEIIIYPYSTRELVNAVRHLEAYPAEGLYQALQNVFEFDSHEPDFFSIIQETLTKNGIPVGLESTFKVELGVEMNISPPEVIEKWMHNYSESSVIYSSSTSQFKTRVN